MTKSLNAGKNPASRRLVRAARTRRVQARLRVSRLVVHLSGQHTYAQIVSPQARVLVSASTVEKDVRKLCRNGGNTVAATAVGRRLAEKAVAVGEVGKLAFDRGGRKYTGRVRALAEAAREGGLVF